MKISRRSTYVITVNTPWKTYTTETWHCLSECRKNAPDAYTKHPMQKKKFLRKRNTIRNKKTAIWISPCKQKYPKIQWKFTGDDILLSRETTKHTRSKISVALPYNVWKTTDNIQYQGKQVKTQVWYGLEQNRNWSSSRLDQDILGWQGSEVMHYNTHTIT